MKYYAKITIVVELNEEENTITMIHNGVNNVVANMFTDKAMKATREWGREIGIVETDIVQEKDL